MQVIEEGELAVGLGMIQGPGGFLVGGGELAGDEILLNGGAVQHFAAAGDKVLGAFQDDAQFF